MKKIWLLCIAFLLVNSGTLYASNPSFEQTYYDAGFKSVQESLTECEHLFQREIKLPKIEPPVKFTHRFGKCNYVKEDGISSNNYHFEAEYLNQSKGEDHFIVRVYPIKNSFKGFPRERDTIQTYSLTDGSKAILGTTPGNGFNVLVFEKEGWYYILSSARRSEKITGDVLIQVANSI
ncbi:hypothetical protein HQN89_02205 [Paenibacillus frigoriresistens]|uniref:hypothetical protein n=1 Tax=Paenibacillus alginolyticus TaxID=59839 RepID=UPI0015654304|nr:hypothetical protein [Paenibacillus frigoriresistens]NRF89852.1 hypothetical protein [Paenibacillus frigoriresistens]